MKLHENHERGSKRHNAKLTEEDVPIICQLYADGMPQKEIAEKFAVSQSTISQTVRGLKWRHA